MADRHYCATCRHIVAEAGADAVVFRCRRLGWETRPQWRFRCWQERPASLPMPKAGGSARTEADAEDR